MKNAKQAPKTAAKNVEETFEHLVGGDASGFEQLTTDVMAYPFLRVLQAMSPALKPSSPEYQDTARQGMLLNSISHTLFTPPLSVVVGKFEHYFIEWKPNRGGFVSAHDPEAIQRRIALGDLTRNERNQLCDDKTKNLFNETYMYYVVLPDYLEEGIMLLALSSTQLKEARKWNRLLVSTLIPGTGRKALPYFMKWELTTPEVKNDRGSWNGIKIAFDGFIGPNILQVITNERKQLAAAPKPDLTLLEGVKLDDEEHADPTF
jgi:hypothetical protein